MMSAIDQYNILMQLAGGFLGLAPNIAFKYPIT